MKSITSPERGIIQHAPLSIRLRKVLLTAIAVLFTLAPIFSISLWIRNEYFSDPRHAVALKRLPALSEPPHIFDEPIVTVAFDDGWESIYSNGAPILQKYGIRSTQYILSGQFDQFNYLSRDQVLSLQRAGHDIESHTITHPDLTTVSDSQLHHEVSDSQKALANLTGKRALDFASPLNAYDNRTLNEIKRYYRSQRNTEDSPTQMKFNQAKNFDRWQINAFSVRRTTPDEDIKKFLQAAKEKKAWAILVYHEVDDDSTSYYAVTKKHFSAQMQIVKQSRLKQATMREVLDYYFLHFNPNTNERRQN